MKTQKHIIPFLIFVIATLACSTATITTDPAARETQMAQDVQATLNAQTLTETAPTGGEVENTPLPEAVPATAEPPAPTDPPPATDIPTVDFDTWVQTASVLLYEDMAGDYSTTRFIKQALDNLGYPYVDVGDAQGNFKNQILSNGPGGAGWDLIISASEYRDSVQGEFYVYLNDALNLGSSVIIEMWNLESIANGTVGNILSRCGVEFQRDWFNEPLNNQLLWPVGGDNPILHTPNEGIELRNPTGYWFSDLGDLLRLAPGSNATILWSARATESTSYGTAVTCLDGQLIIQTYSTHNYGKDRVIKIWENYIYNTLLTRYNSTQP